MMKHVTSWASIDARKESLERAFRGIANGVLFIVGEERGVVKGLIRDYNTGELRIMTDDEAELALEQAVYCTGNN